VSGFIATPPAPASPVDSSVSVDDWFPAIDVNSIRDTLRIGEGVVTHERLVAAIEGAVITALRQLHAWRSAWAAGGANDLASIDDVSIGGRKRSVVLWERIIRYYAAAEVADTHRDLVASDQANIRSENERLTADEYRRMAHHAISDLLSIGAEKPVPRNRVSLL
jgi:hypothetical protein